MIADEDGNLPETEPETDPWWYETEPETDPWWYETAPETEYPWWYETEPETNGDIQPDTDSTDDVLLTYAANGGTGAPQYQCLTQGEQYTISLQEPRRPGYVFSGWSTDPSASAATYQPGDRITLPTTEHSLTLYAIWTREVVDTDPETDGSTPIDTDGSRETAQPESAETQPETQLETQPGTQPETQSPNNNLAIGCSSTLSMLGLLPLLGGASICLLRKSGKKEDDE